MAGIREIKDPINAQGLEDIIYNFQYLYLKLVALSGGQDVEQMLADLERLIREANEAMESYEVLEPRLIAAAEDAEAQAEAARIQAEYVASVKPAIDYFINQQTNLQNQINQLVVNGDSSPEAAQARVGVDGFASPTLKASIDRQINALSKSTQNLLLNTINENSFTLGTISGNPSVFSVLKDRDGSNYYRVEARGDNLIRLIGEQPIANRYEVFENGKTYTISFLARSNRTDLSSNYVYLLNTPTPNLNVSPNMPLSNEWTLHHFTFTWNLGAVLSRINIGMQPSSPNIVDGDYFEFKNVMINEGVLPLPFYPNYLDLKKLFEETLLFKPTTIVDFNQLTKPGNYLLVGTNGLVNAPNNTHTYYVTIYNRVANDFATQFAKRVGTNEYFTRSQTAPNSSNWTEWQPVTLFKSTTAQAQAGTDDLTYMTPLKTSQSIQRKTGDLNTLGTIEKSDLVAAINEVLQSVSNFKSTIAGAITDRGINTPATANSATMASNIALIVQPKQASGLVNVNTESLPFSFYDMSATEDANYVTVSGLNFRPRRIIVFNPNVGIPSVTEYSYQLAVLDESIRIYRLNGAQITTVVSNFKNNVSSAFVNNGGFRLPVDGTGNNWEWYAYEY